MDKCHSDWPPEMWKTRIVDRVQVYEADQRRWLVRQVIAARLDSIEGVRQYIKELRVRWPGPDDCHPLDPAGILEQLWAAMHLLGLSPSGLPPMAPSAKLFAARLRDDAEAHAVRAEEWRSFHDALNKAEQAVSVALSPSVNVAEGIVTATGNRHNKPKRSTERGEARTKIVAALNKHHRYQDGSCLNQEPIGNNDLARRVGVSRGAASGFFRKEFHGHTKYRAACRNTTILVTALKLFNGEYSPSLLYGSAPPGEGERDDGPPGEDESDDE